MNWIDINYPWEVSFEGAGYVMTAVPTVVCGWVSKIVDKKAESPYVLYAARLIPLGLTSYERTAEAAVERLQEGFRLHLEAYKQDGRLDWYLNRDNVNEMDWVL